MLKKIVTASLAAAAMTASAYAADLPVRQPPPPPPVPVCTWCGFYLGVNGGGAFTRAQSLPYLETFGGAAFFPATGLAEFGPLPSRSGRFGGGQAGINWQGRAVRGGGEPDAPAARLPSAAATPIRPDPP